MEYIAHHGILGQKWGVRRYQNPDGSYTDEGRERYGIGRPLKSKDSRTAQRGRVNHNDPKHPDIKAGTKLYRVSSNKNDIGNERLYVTYDETKDRNYYLSGIWNPTNSKVLYEQYMEAVKDIKVAALPVVGKVAYDIYGNDPEKVGKAFVDGLAKTRMAGMPVEMLKAYDKWDGTKESVKNFKIKGYEDPDALSDVLNTINRYRTKKEILNDLYDRYERNPTSAYRDAIDATNTDAKAAKELKNRLQKLGYDAQVDGAGLGSFESGRTKSERKENGVYGTTANDPIIIYDSKDKVKVSKDPAKLSKDVSAVADMLSRDSTYNYGDTGYNKHTKRYTDADVEALIEATKSKISKIKNLSDKGKSSEYIAKKCGISIYTVEEALKEDYTKS